MSMRQAALQQENATLRGLNAAMPEVIEKRLIGEVISVEVSTLRQRLLINRGGNSGVLQGAARDHRRRRARPGVSHRARSAPRSS